MSDIVEKLNQLDLQGLTVDDIRNLKNKNLREALMKIARPRGLPAAAGDGGESNRTHSNNSSHTDFPSEMA